MTPPGLSAGEARSRLATVGPNEIHHEVGVAAWKLLGRQFESPLVLLLLGATGISAALGHGLDGVAIAAIVLLNAMVGFYQEYSAQNAVLALRAMTAPRARVIRDGEAVVLPAADVVPGDVLMLEAGDIVSADARLLEAHALETNESALTGESLPVDKSARPVPESAPLAERTDRVFLGTAVAAGTGLAEVVSTGMRTELGRIAHLLAASSETVTPLQRELAAVGRALLWICLALVATVAGAGLVHGRPWLEVVVLAVPLAVAAVPEGLPAVVTIALSVGVQRMAVRNVLVRRLPAVETLGSATVICTDKTGTLTSGGMAVRDLWGRDPVGVLRAAASCCDATLGKNGEGTGDPTEVAILRAARERGIEVAAIDAASPRIAVNPFDGDRKRMSVQRADGRLYVKGAVDLLLPRCVRGGEGAVEANAEMGSRGLRVLAVAVGQTAEEKDLELLGLIVLQDPPRPEAIEAIAAARRAGITVVMITGDHTVTALAIAREMGLILPGDDPAERVHARVTPEDKLAIVRKWKERGEVVAMTGDGVNDAPALREAHIGIAMGKTGTEVTREAADMVLADDNFASIVAAVREGRGIWENIQKAAIYLLAGNLGELLAVVAVAVVGLPFPLLPVHLLWVNLVSDGLPALALVIDPPPRDALERKPRAPGTPLLGRAEWRRIGLTGALQGAVVLAVFLFALTRNGLDSARQLAFYTLVFIQLFWAFGARSPTKTFFEVGAFSNLRLVGVVAVSGAVQLALCHLPVTQRLFHLHPLSLGEAALVIGLGLVPVSAVELAKLGLRLTGPRSRPPPVPPTSRTDPPPGSPPPSPPPAPLPPR